MITCTQNYENKSNGKVWKMSTEFNRPKKDKSGNKGNSQNDYSDLGDQPEHEK
jgi:hypothetical protein